MGLASATPEGSSSATLVRPGPTHTLQTPHLAGPRIMRRKMRVHSRAMAGPGVDPTALSRAVRATTFSDTLRRCISLYNCGTQAGGAVRRQGEVRQCAHGWRVRMVSGGWAARHALARHPHAWQRERPGITNNCSPHTCSAQWPCRAAAHSEKSVPNVMVSGARPAFFISS